MTDEKKLVFIVKDPKCKKNRMKVGRYGQVYKDKAVTAFEWEIRKAIRDSGDVSWLTEVSAGFTVHIRYSTGRDEAEVCVQRSAHDHNPKRRKDIGNMADVLLDAMQNVVYENDKQVVQLLIEEVD